MEWYFNERGDNEFKINYRTKSKKLSGGAGESSHSTGFARITKPIDETFNLSDDYGEQSRIDMRVSLSPILLNSSDTTAA